MSASEEDSQGPVIRDRRRIDPVTGQARQPGADTRAAAGQVPPGGAQPRPGRHAVSKPGSPRPGAAAADQASPAGPGPAGTGAAGPGSAEPADQDGPGGGTDPAGDGSAAAAGAPATGTSAGGAAGGAAGATGSTNGDPAVKLAERTADLQRVQAEYANYRKRVERDRAAVRELSVASVLGDLLPVLDDIGRAREHGELTGGFKSVAESLEAAVTKLGLTTYGQAGEPFDPNVHEALMHSYSADVAETTCVQVLQPGYKVGERILRPARVAVAEPAGPGDAPPPAAPRQAGSGEQPVPPADPPDESD